MVPLSPSLLIAAASSFVGIAQSPRNYLAELFRHAPLGADEEMWGLHFLHHVGSRSHLDHDIRVSSWPVPTTRFVDELVRIAAGQKVLYKTAPQAGDIFALWSPAKDRYTRAGIIVRADSRQTPGPDGRASYECSAIECVIRVVDGAVTRGVILRDRRLDPGKEKGDRFIRWTEMRQGKLRFTEAA